MFSPRTIFFLLWMGQILLHIIFNKVFFPFSDETWLVIGIGFFSFFFGTYIFQFILEQRYKNQIVLEKFSDLNYSKIAKIFVVLYIPLFFYVIYSARTFFLGLGLLGFDAPAIRQMVVDDFNGDRYIYSLFRYLYMGVGCCIFLLTFSDKLSKFDIILLLFIGVVSSLATTGRLFLLLFFSSVVALLYRNKVISIKMVLGFCFAFIFLFFAAALLLGKGSESNGSEIGGGVLWNAQIYLMSSVSCFNDYIEGGVADFEGSILIPNQIKVFLSYIYVDIPLRPSLNPFSYVPEPCNTYTLLFPLYHDAGFIGVGLGLFLIGGGHQFLYMKYQSGRDKVWWYVYAISIYPLVMTIFEDAYFSSIGFWMLLWIPVVIYKFLILIRKYGKAHV